MKERERSRLRLERVGFVFQLHHLLPQCSALENVLVPTLGWRDAAARDRAPERARQLLERVGLSARADHRPGQLSGGECQRVALVRALIGRPSLLLADEPTGSLDAESAGDVVTLLAETAREEGAALVMVTHAEVLAERMDRVLELRLGRLTERAPRS
jgi:lipoprotein-releasing system ATP-binding protein